MKKGKSLITKIVLFVLVALLLTFTTVNLIVSQIIKQEVLAQWKTEDYKLVQAYGEVLMAEDCETAEDYQRIIDRINKENHLNYALYMEDIDGKVTAVAHSNPDRIGLVLEDEGSIAATREGKPYVGYYTDQVTGGLTLDVLTPIVNEEGQQQGALNIGIPVDQATMNQILANSLLKVTMTSLVLSVLLLIVLSILIYMLIVRPIKRLAGNISRMAGYDLSSDKTGIMEQYCRRTDEIGMISNDFETMRKSIIALVGEIAGVTGKLAGQSVSLSEVSERVAEMGNQLSQTVNEVANGATNQAQETTEGEEQVSRLSDLIETVQENMDTLSKATENVSKIKDKGVEALEIVVSNTEKNAGNSSKVHEVIMETSRQTDRIKEASERIREISAQTNLLALNASIEAARAGDAGRGFAVVATEIGNLANGTNELTAKIEEIIQDLVEKMNHTVNMIDSMMDSAKVQSESVSDTKEKFDLIAEHIRKMEENCMQLAHSTEKMEESRNVIVGVVSNLSAISEENAACMEEAAASVEEQAKAIDSVSDSSIQVAALADKLTQEVGRFVID